MKVSSDRVNDLLVATCAVYIHSLTNEELPLAPRMHQATDRR